MVSLNPFKKKEEEGFSLDNESLQSLSDVNQNNSQTNSSPLPQSDTSSMSSSSSPFPSQDLAQTKSPFDSSNQEHKHDSSDNHHKDYSKAKLDSIDSKVSLLEARISNMDQKIDVIFSMLSAEISEETKSKLKIDSMIDRIKNK